MDKPVDWDPVQAGRQVSLNHDFGWKPEVTKMAAKAEAGRPAKPSAFGKSTLTQGSAGFRDHESLRKAEKEKEIRQTVNSKMLDSLGVSWGGENRSLLDGPKYGNYGGKNHTGGSDGTKQPIDTSDRIYKQHDLGWAECEALPQAKQGICKDKHDADLVRRLEELSQDATEWPHPPPRDLKNDAERFRKGAIYWFKE